MLLMGKSTISMAIFNSYVSHYQRVKHVFFRKNIRLQVRHRIILGGFTVDLPGSKTASSNLRREDNHRIRVSCLVDHPTNRFCGLVHPSDFSGLTLQKSHVNHWGELTHLRFVG